MALIFLDKEDWVKACEKRNLHVIGNFALSNKTGATRGTWNRNSGEGRIYIKEKKNG
jgi:hypothetical protein